MAIDKPNYTQVPNILLDKWMAEMSECELRVMLVAVRQIMGYHKIRPEGISISQFEKMTGLSRQGVFDGIEQAIQRGNLRKAGTGKRNLTLFELVIAGEDDTDETPLVNVVDQSTSLTSSSQHSLPVDSPTGKRSRHTKETTLKENEKENTPLPPQGEVNGKTSDTEYTSMNDAVKSLLKQHNKTQRASITNALLQRHTGTKADMNTSSKVTVEQLNEFCLWWDESKVGRDGKSLTRPKNQGSIKQWVDEWLSEQQTTNDTATASTTRDIREIFKGRYLPTSEVQND